MLNFYVTCAVPFGYIQDIDFDSEGIQSDMLWHNLETRRGLPPLPDVILSNTPPPSPLRRAHSYLSFFPEKPTHALPTPPLAPPALDTPPLTPSETHARAASVEHIQEVRRRLQNNHPEPQSPHTLPQLSWPLPRPQEEGSQEEREGNQGAEGERGDDERRWRMVGRDLQKIADEFQLHHGKVGVKRESEEETLNLSVPVALTRCLSASILFLVWWRLFNKFHWSCNPAPSSPSCADFSGATLGSAGRTCLEFLCGSSWGTQVPLQEAFQETGLVFRASRVLDGDFRYWSATTLASFTIIDLNKFLTNILKEISLSSPMSPVLQISQKLKSVPERLATIGLARDISCWLFPVHS